MYVLVTYESMFGNTRLIAEQIATGFALVADVCVLPTQGATPDLVRTADLVVVGAPTHAHTLSTAQSRQGARDIASRSGGSLHLDPDSESLGVRDWFRTCPDGHGKLAAAFDTRYDASPVLTGRASRGIARRIHDRGYRMVTEPESFLVTHANVIASGEELRAFGWGIELSEMVSLLTAH